MDTPSSPACAPASALSHSSSPSSSFLTVLYAFLFDVLLDIRKALNRGSSAALSLSARALAQALSVSRRMSFSPQRKKLRMEPHVKARTSPYQGGEERFPVPDDKVPWAVPFPEYKPRNYTASIVLSEPPWADKEKDLLACNFNQVDGNVSRVSFEGEYTVDKDTHLPLNPRGRTGMCGRGLLGRFGPNHAADPVVTRWKRDEAGAKVLGEDGLPLVEFVAIRRKDTNEWAFPGGMVEPGATVTHTLLAEFGEEAMNSLEMTDEERSEMEKKLSAFFENGNVVYQGYVDDPRNTDNAWMETVAMHFHDENGDSVGRFDLKSGDDAGAVAWTTITPDLKLYASHATFLRQAWENLLRPYRAPKVSSD